MEDPEDVERNRAGRPVERAQYSDDAVLAEAVRRGLVTPAALPPGPPPEAPPVTRLAELLRDLDEDRAER